MLGLMAVVLALVASACGSDDSGSTSAGGENLSGTIKIDGSSTVAPLSEAAAELFQAENPGVQVTVGTAGTGGGFEKFCRGETDISDASRKIKTSEADLCKANGVVYDEFTVANDGLSVVVNSANDWAKCLTTAQLKKIWDQGSTITNWKDVDPSFPDQKMDLYGAGTDSGTFDYFTEAINGKEGQSRTDYQATEDDNVTVQGVSGSKGALGYFGLSYLEQNKAKVKGVAIDSGAGCVEPTTETVQDGTYKPLGRPLFIYPTQKVLERPEGLAFVEYYIANTTPITEQALFVDLTSEQKTKLADQLDKLKAGGQGPTTTTP
ncbi:MAG: PstS family phosphate ABC transporter substrate-binding protein [Acidimicrobiia bacterium]|nr:PstS family phosphate ABC transporter substrate-binding protein [Acidimicrobiia bacterium]